MKEFTSVDLTKPLLSNNEPVTLITTEGRGQFPLLGYRGDGITIMYWDKQGKNRSDRAFDLVNPPPPKKTLYVNVYPDNDLHAHPSWEAADIAAGTRRIACVRVEYTEGQFDD